MFKDGLDKLIKLASKNRTVYMYSEAVWCRCHRSIFSDALKVSGWDVIHIMGVDKGNDPPYTGPANIKENRLTYEEA